MILPYDYTIFFSTFNFPVRAMIYDIRIVFCNLQQFKKKGQYSFATKVSCLLLQLLIPQNLTVADRVTQQNDILIFLQLQK